MHRFFRSMLSLGLLLAPLAMHATAPSPVSSVDPFIGSDGHGHTFPGAVLPFGMAVLSPDTRTETWDGCSGYLYSDTTILGFSHTHLSGTGGGCLGDVMVMPTVGAVHFDAGKPGDGYISRFSHTRESAQPGYYRVYLQDPKVTAELTATERCGFHRYTFPASDAAHIAIDLDHGIQSHASDSEVHAENSTTISGFRKSNGWGGDRTVYYVMQFSKPFDSIDLQKSGQQLSPGTNEASGGVVKASVNFHTRAGEAVLIKVGVSGTSIEGARKNLKTEIPGWDFKSVRNAAALAWSKVLDTAQIETPDPHIRRAFYTNFYLSCIGPSKFNDVDGAYRGLDHKVHTQPGFQNYTAFSLWDTYRAEHPLLTLVQPERVDDMVSTLLTAYGQQGSRTTPIWPLWDNETWCMIGYHSTAVMADAYLKGFRGFNAEAAYQAMRDTAMQDRNGQDTFKTLGYVASTPGMQATSKTIEYAVDDWCIARMADALGHHDDAQMFYKRAGHYVNLYDTTTGFMRGRKENGDWRPKFDAIGQINDEYTEADAWQYNFAVQQDVPGMIRMHGGDAAFIHKLDTLFTMSSKTRTIIPDITGLIGQYAQGDEQCHHIAYLYDYAGQPYKTQKWVREIMRTQYSDAPNGECGNVDCGQMSAWYVFSTLGFYPVNPAAGVYAIGSPNVAKSVLHLDAKKYGGRTFTLIAQNNSAQNIYIQSATWNGKPFDRTWITHNELTGGGVLSLVMGPKPNPQWGASSASRPPATMPADFQYAKFPKPAMDQQVTLKPPIRVAAGSDDPIGDFVSDPNMLDGQQHGSDEPVDINVPNAGPLGVYQSERYSNDFTWSYPVPKGRYTVRLHFADVFDKAPGDRVENVSVNGATVLKDFDIIKTAGGTHKAVVKSFPGVRPDAAGAISIRIWAAAASPDQNAKINGIEILPE